MYNNFWTLIIIIIEENMKNNRTYLLQKNSMALKTKMGNEREVTPLKL